MAKQPLEQEQSFNFVCWSQKDVSQDARKMDKDTRFNNEGVTNNGTAHPLDFGFGSKSLADSRHAAQPYFHPLTFQISARFQQNITLISHVLEDL